MTLIVLMALTHLMATPEAAGHNDLAAEVRAAETAFARGMADRDHAAFVSHLADEAVFFSKDALRGRGAVAEGWEPSLQGREAPFS